MKKMSCFCRLLRVKHYIKNILIFVPLLFSRKLFDQNYFFIAVCGYISFCLVASSVYIMNDIADRKKDALHPIKKKRPIASGEVSLPVAFFLLCFLLGISFFLLFQIKAPFLTIFLLVLYFVINIGYSFGLKNIPLLDVIIIVSGFLIRVLFGATLLGIEVSNWLYLTILALSFYLALGKRRNEIRQNGTSTRKVLKYYSKEFLDKNMYLFLTMTIIFYSLWATDTSIVKRTHNLLIWTIPVVIVICMRYSMDIEGSEDGDPTEVIFKDKILMGLSFLLGLLFLFILYYGG